MGEHSMKSKYIISILSLLFIFSLVLSSVFLVCKTPPQPNLERDQKCGDCLSQPSGEVCTELGTLKNDCMAICHNVRILCHNACPCKR